MRPMLGLALLVLGVVLLIWGLQSSDSIASSFHRFFDGTPTDKTVWLISGGVVAALCGVGMLAMSKRVAKG